MGKDEAKRFLSGADILASEDLARTAVHVPEWDTWLYIRPMTAGQRGWWESAALSNAVPPDLKCKVVSMCAVDESGARLFSDRDVPRLMQKHQKPITDLFRRVLIVSGISVEVDDDAGAEAVRD